MRDLRASLLHQNLNLQSAISCTGRERAASPEEARYRELYEDLVSEIISGLDAQAREHAAGDGADGFARKYALYRYVSSEKRALAATQQLAQTTSGLESRLARETRLRQRAEKQRDAAVRRYAELRERALAWLRDRPTAPAAELIAASLPE